MHTIFHLDLDAFFVSVERVLDPSLQGKAVVIGADPRLGRGVVSTCSYEAREYGLHSAMPILKAYRLCPHAIYISGHKEEYGKYSKKVKILLQKYAPEIEQASIDEFYMDFTGCKHIYGSYYDFASRLQKEILKVLELPCSIGIASNKTVAKIASDYNKPLGITYVEPGMEKDFLAPMAVEKIPGVGKVTLEIFHKIGVKKIEDITKLSREYLQKKFGKYGEVLLRKAEGKGNQNLSLPTMVKSISKEKTFIDNVVDEEIIEKTLLELTGKVCQSLRHKSLETSTISIKLRYYDFETVMRSKTILPTNDDKIVYETIISLFKKNYKKKIALRLLGVHTSNLRELKIQQDLFENENINRKQMLKAIDAIRNEFGYKSINLGCK